MKTIITVIGLAALILLWPSIFFLFFVGLPIFLILKVGKTGKKKMTKAEKRKAFNDEIMYY